MKTNRRNIIPVFMAVWFLLLPQGLQAQQKIPVELTHTGSDSSGQRLAYKLKEHVRKSLGLRLTNTNEPRLRVILASVETGLQSNIAAISYVITLSGSHLLDSYLTSGVLTFGVIHIDSASESLVATIDQQADVFRKYSGAKP